MRFGRWESSKELGVGGQGSAYLAFDAEARTDALAHLRAVLVEAGVTGSPDLAAELLLDFLRRDVSPTPDNELAVVKSYKIPSGPKGDQARERFRIEVAALEDLRGNPAVLQLIETNADDGWMATEYQPFGTLDKNLDRFAGRPLESLEALRPIIAAVAELHKNGRVHRDIKPENIFVGRDRQLVLGDFGIVFFADPEKTRLTNTLERVGTQVWMAPWVNTGTRLEDVPPNFDVFALGKVLWSMVSGKLTPLPFWWWSKTPHNLETLNADADMRFIDRLLSHTVVEEEADCYPNAQTFLMFVDQTIDTVRHRGRLFRNDLPGRCTICGTGQYRPPWKAASERWSS